MQHLNFWELSYSRRDGRKPPLPSSSFLSSPSCPKRIWNLRKLTTKTGKKFLAKYATIENLLTAHFYNIEAHDIAHTSFSTISRTIITTPHLFTRKKWEETRRGYIPQTCDQACVCTSHRCYSSSSSSIGLAYYRTHMKGGFPPPPPFLLLLPTDFRSLQAEAASLPGNKKKGRWVLRTGVWRFPNIRFDFCHTV